MAAGPRGWGKSSHLRWVWDLGVEKVLALPGIGSEGGRGRQQVNGRPLPCHHLSARFSIINLGREGLRKPQKVPEWGSRASQAMSVREGVFTGKKEDNAEKVSLESNGRAHSQYRAQSRGGLSTRHCSSCPRAPNTPSTQAWMAVQPFRDQIPL